MDEVTLFHEFARDRLRSQEALNGEYGTKAHNMFTLGTALIGAAAVIINLPDTNIEHSIRFWTPIGILSLAFLFVAVSSILALWMRDWRYGPKENDFARYIHDHDAKTIERWAAETYNESANRNNEKLRSKGRWIQFALFGLILETIALFAVGIICCWP